MKSTEQIYKEKREFFLLGRDLFRELRNVLFDKLGVKYDDPKNKELFADLCNMADICEQISMKLETLESFGAYVEPNLISWLEQCEKIFPEDFKLLLKKKLISHE